MGRVLVVGGSLAGLAAAARLARVGHGVTLVEESGRLGGPRLPDGPVDLPAAWRDLFAKTGRPAAGALGALGLTLVPADLDFPADRAGQWRRLHDRFGPGASTRWRDLVDHYDDVWQALRPLGLEGELVDRAQVDRVAGLLEPHLSVADVVRRLDHPALATLVADALPGRDPAATPAWLLSRLSVQRTFGRWWLADADGRPQPSGRLVDALVQRVYDRGVDVRPGTSPTAATFAGADAVVIALLPQPAPAWRPLRRRLLGPRPSFADQWFERPPLRDPHDRTRFHASAASRGGDEPWAQLLTGALAAYAVHETLTGEDIRPTNKDLRRH